MKLINANAVRSSLIEKLYKEFSETEDVGMVSSNSFNFPVVEDGEEGWVEIVVKVTKDGGDDGYLKRDEYKMKCEEKAEKAKVAAEKRQRKSRETKNFAKKRKRKKRENNPSFFNSCIV